MTTTTISDVSKGKNLQENSTGIETFECFGSEVGEIGNVRVHEEYIIDLLSLQDPCPFYMYSATYGQDEVPYIEEPIAGTKLQNLCDWVLEQGEGWSNHQLKVLHDNLHKLSNICIFV